MQRSMRHKSAITENNSNEWDTNVILRRGEWGTPTQMCHDKATYTRDNALFIWCLMSHSTIFQLYMYMYTTVTWMRQKFTKMWIAQLSNWFHIPLYFLSCSQCSRLTFLSNSCPFVSDSHCLHIVAHSYCIHVTLFSCVSHSSQLLSRSQLLYLRFVWDLWHVCVAFAARSCQSSLKSSVKWQEWDTNVHSRLFVSHSSLHSWQRQRCKKQWFGVTLYSLPDLLKDW